jgi:CHAT domain-containing protein
VTNTLPGHLQKQGLLANFSAYGCLLMRCFLVKIFCAAFVWSNAHAADSLKRALEYHQGGEFKSALPLLISLAANYRSQNDWANYALCQIKLADMIRMYGGPNLAIEMLNQNEALLQTRLESSLSLLAQNHIAKAEAHYGALRLTEFKKEISRSLKVKIRAQLPEVHLAEDYLHLARYYKEMPNRNDSCFYFLGLALRLAKADKVNKFLLLARIYNLFGYYYHPASIVVFLNKRDSFYRTLNLSRRYYDSALWAVNQQEIKDVVMLSRIYHNLGNSYNNEYSESGQKAIMDKAMQYYRISYGIFRNFGSPADLALRNWVIARGYERLNETDSAIRRINAGLHWLMPEYGANSHLDIPPLKPTLNDQRFITLFALKTTLLQRLSTQSADTTRLLAAYRHWAYLMKFNQYVISKSGNEIEALHWSYVYGSNAYQNLMAVVYELVNITGNNRYLHESFGLLASGKYAYLNRNDINPDRITQINSNILYGEYDVVLKNIVRATTMDEARIRTMLPRLPARQAENKISAGNLGRTDSVSVSFLQQQMRDANSAYIDFFLHGQTNYAVVILKNGFKLFKYSPPANSGLKVKQLNEGAAAMSARQYAKAAYSLYQELLQPVLKDMPESVNRLMICPDGYLQQVAWDALVTDTANTGSFQSLSYLLKRYIISTVLSPLHLKRANETADNSFTGIAPDFAGSKILAEIPFSRDLVKRMSRKYGGSFGDSFSHTGESTAILHVATHVKPDTLHPFNSVMYLAYDSITMGALARISVKPKLAVLNGCSSGIGASLYTEGAISFARAFYRLGAESVLLTLWNVDDKATAGILETFYGEMDKGIDLARALHHAKLEFLSQQKSDELANPYYWAGLQISGRHSPLFKAAQWHGYIIALLIASSLAFWFFRIKRKIRV